MSIDLRQFHQTFFEESLEGVAIMETELLHMEKNISRSDGKQPCEIDKEALNTIFRVVHSIKGGSSTFGFGWVADFSHILESLLDDLREGGITINRDIVKILIRSVDCLRELLVSAHTNSAVNVAMINDVRMALEELQMPGEFSQVDSPRNDTERAGVEQVTRWRIAFKPPSGIFASGNDPLRIIRDLSGHCELEARADVSLLPAWERLDPESCYLGWNIGLKGEVTKQAIDDVFAWVADSCSIEIAPLNAPARPQEATAKQPPAQAYVEATTSIRVSTPKVDALVDIVGELVITQTMLQELTRNFSIDALPRLAEGLMQLERNTRDLQDSVMSIRMLPIGFIFNRLPRMVRDVSQHLGKKVELSFSGERTELDKTVIERISDPLIHLVRNCVDHGIEPSSDRLRAGKPETASIHIDAFHKGGNVIVEIRDDGQGLQRQKIFEKAVNSGLVAPDAKLTPEQIDELIFLPGFSTAVKVSDVSGRGVGMDVVRNNIRSLGGGVEVVSSPNKGTTFTMHLPLTLAIVDGLSIEVGTQTYIVPLTSIVESIRISDADISRPAGGPELFAMRKEYLPLIRLHELFGIEPHVTEISQGILVVVEAEGKKAGLFVDDLLGQQQVVIKSLETHCRKVDGISAATILGNGSVALILDVPTLIRYANADSTDGSIPGMGSEWILTGNQQQPSKILPSRSQN